MPDTPKTSPWADLIGSLISGIVIPEVADIIRSRHQQTGTFPTDAEILAELDLRTARGIQRGEDFLTRHGGT